MAQIIAQPVLKRTSASTLGQSPSLAQGLAQAGQNILGATQQVGQIASGTAGALAKWQNQIDSGKLARFQVESKKLQDEYLLSVQDNKGEKAVTNEELLNNFKNNINKALTDLDGISDAAREKGELYRDSLFNDTSLREIMYNISEQKKAMNANLQSSSEITALDVAGAADPDRYIDEAQQVFTDAASVIFEGQSVKQKEFVIKANNAMFKEHIYDLITQDPTAALIKLTDDNINDYSNRYTFGSEFLTTKEKTDLRKLAQKAIGDNNAAERINFIITQMAPNGDVSKGVNLYEAEAKIQEWFQNGEITAEEANKIRTGIQSAFSNQLSEIKRQDEEIVQSTAKDYLERLETLTTAYVRGHPKFDMLPFQVQEHFLKIAAKNEDAGAGGYDSSSPEVRRWEAFMLERIRTGVIKAGDLESFFSNGDVSLEDGTVLDWQDIPKDTYNRVFSAFNSKTNNLPNYIDEAISRVGISGRNKLTSDDRNLLSSQLTDYVISVGLDPYDKSNKDILNDVAADLYKNIGDSDRLQWRIERDIQRLSPDEDRVRRAKSSSQYSITNSEFSDNIARASIRNGKSYDALMKEYARDNEWIDVEYAGGLSQNQDINAFNYNSIGLSYGVDPNLLASIHRAVETELEDKIADPTRSGILAIPNDYSAKKGDGYLNFENDKDSIEVLAMALREAATVGNLTVSESIAGILRNLNYTDSDSHTQEVINSVFENLNGIKKHQTVSRINNYSNFYQGDSAEIYTSDGYDRYEYLDWGY